MRHLKAKAVALLSFCFIFIGSQGLLAQKNSAEAPSTQLKLNPNVRSGILPNGMTYFVMKNTEPENRAELRLAVNAGSMMEDDDQQGLAHFVEHMAFNGSKHFKKSELVDYLESIGTKFGAHLNAYTSFDETVYMLQVPTDDDEIMKKAFWVLEDWAGAVSFDNEEIDKERGVVIEEWRLGLGADARMRDRYFPVIFKDSRYAERLPIGKKDILENFDYETVKRFYKDWYRPDLMAVIAVGDFDPDKMEQRIKEQFSKIPASKNPRERGSYSVPDNKDLLVAVEQDPEAPMTVIQLMYRMENDEDKTEQDYRRYLKDRLVSSMVSDRLDELKNSGKTPLMFAGSYKGNMIRTKTAFSTFALMRPDGIREGSELVLTEIERANQHGFIESELDRQKEKILKEYEKSYKERENTPSRNHAGELVSYFLSETPVPGIESEFEMAKKYLPGISLKEVNQAIKSWVSNGNQAIVITGPEKDGMDFPSKKEVEVMAMEIQKKKLDPYTEEVDDSPLMANMPAAGSVTATNTFKEVGVTEWTLSNGAKVILKPTDFKSDEVLFDAISLGGSSHASMEDFESVDNAGNIIAQSGVAQFSKSQLDKKMAGKVVRVNPFISHYQEGFRGNCSPEDLETLLQMVHLYFTQPRKDKDAFEGFKTDMEGYAAMSNSPEGTFNDSLTLVRYQNHPMFQPLTKEGIASMDLETAYKAYKERFKDASDFTFIFTGNFDEAKTKSLVETYLASLPNMGRKESFKDNGERLPDGIVKKTVRRGVEPKARVQISFHGDFEWTSGNRYKMRAMQKVYSIMLREVMREEKGGVYGVRVNAYPTKYPVPHYEVSIGFGCSPENVEDLVATVFAKAKELSKKGASDKNLQKVKETHRREYETNVKSNRYWQGVIRQYSYYKDQVKEFGSYLDMVDQLTAKDIGKTAKKYLNPKQYYQVILLPEK